MFIQQNSRNSLYPPDDRDFNSSRCDYNSDVFKEQPSQIEYSKQYIKAVGQINLESEEEGDENFIVSPQNNNIYTPLSKLDSNNSMRVSQAQVKMMPSHKQSQGGDTNIMAFQSESKNTSSKVSCEQSFQQNFKPQIIMTQSNQKNKKRPLYSLVPEQINKNLSKEYKPQAGKSELENNNHHFTHMKSNFMKQNQILSQDTKPSNNENVNILLCEESEVVNHKFQQNLTPDKKLPTPVSPTQRPILSINNSGILNSIISGNQNTGKFYRNNQLTKSGSKNNTYSEQKPSVQYNEYKYLTSGNEITQENYKKYINISSNNGGFQRRSDIITQNYFELSPGNHKIFDLSSPKQSISNSSNFRSNSLRKQIAGFTNCIQDNKNYQLALKFDSQNTEPTCPTANTAYECKIKELQDHISSLESELKESQQKNREIQKKIKEKSFIQSFDRNVKSSKHLSDTEDSLILSEKKAIKRSSIANSVKGPNQNLQNHPTQSLTSIVDLKIRPISNLKQTDQSSPYQRMSGYSNGNNNRETCQSAQFIATGESQDFEEELEYEIDNLNEISSNIEHIHNQENDCEENQEECEGCERLKQLVFQAKEAIDDLKSEIEEWRDLYSEKETELRHLQHRLYNDLIGTEKKTQFNDEDQVKEFDPSRPANFDSKSVKNFIQQNKKRIMSRSKNRHDKKASSTTLPTKRAALKDLKVVSAREDQEYYEAEDQCIQTSFIANSSDYMLTSNDNISRLDNCKSDLKLQTNNPCYLINTNSQNLSPEKHQKIGQNENPLVSSQEHFERESNQNNEELNQLRAKNLAQEQELNKLKVQVSQLSKQCEQFVSLVQKARRNSKKQGQNLGTQFNIQDIKDQYEIVSELESYSILEKINEWKREEGLESKDLEAIRSQIPRPMKLIMEISAEDLEGDNDLFIQNFQTKSVQSPNKEFRNYIKQEQENLRKLQEIKLKELQKQSSYFY